MREDKKNLERYFYQIHTVCASCHGTAHGEECICGYSNYYETIELEQAFCKCCGQMVDSTPPTNFNVLR